MNELINVAVIDILFVGIWAQITTTKSLSTHNMQQS